MSQQLIETLLSDKNFDHFKEFVKSLNDINEYLIKSEENSLNLYHICIGCQEIDFGLKCLNHLLSLKDRNDSLNLNCLAKIEGNVVTGAHIAVLWRHYKALQTLIDSGIDLFICDSYGNSVRDYALKNSDETAIDLIDTAIKTYSSDESFRQKSNEKHLNEMNGNQEKEKKSLTFELNYYGLNQKGSDYNSFENSSSKRCSDLEQTVIYFNENDSICADSQSNCSQNTLISNISYEKTNSIKSCCSDRTEIYVYNDRDHNVLLIEERYEGCIENSDSLEALNRSDVISKGSVTQTDDNNERQLKESIDLMNETKIYSELRAMGDSPGPVTKTTKKTYAKRLFNLRTTKHSFPKQTLSLPTYSEELNRLIEHTFPPRAGVLEEAHKLEKDFVKVYEKDSSKHNYFNYLLLDPNISKDICFHAIGSKIVINSFAEIDRNLFICFIKSIFYAGKGQGNRVYEHFYEAIKTNERQKCSQKVERILKIWSDSKGVISLHCFQDISSNEALARESMIIEALVLTNLTNQMTGHKNKCKLKWNDRKRKTFGSYLLYKSFLIYLLTGERQIRRPTLQTIQ